MADLQIVVDSTAYLKPDYIEKHGVIVVPLQFEFEGELCEEQPSGDGFRDFYRRLMNSTGTIRTSQPSVERFIQAFERALGCGREVLATVISSGVSGTYQAACLAASQVDPERITVIDSKIGATGLRFLVETAIDCAQQGMARMDIAQRVTDISRRLHFELCVSTLDYLRRGGRLTNIQAMIGNLLQMRPIISLRDGVLVAVDRMRGQQKAIEAIVRGIPDSVRRIGVNHIMNQEAAVRVLETLRARFPDVLITLDDIGPVIGAHVGPGTVAICYES